MNSDFHDIAAAFEILLEEIEEIIEGLNEGGADALRRGDYANSRSSADRAERLTAFRTEVKELQRQGEEILYPSDKARAVIGARSKSAPDQRSRRRKLVQRLERGSRTSEDAYRLPVLEALERLGGLAKVSEVLDLVGQKMAAHLNEYDRQLLASGQVRWRNAAQWCRHSLVREGLLSGSSAQGVWEITEQGRRELRRASDRAPRAPGNVAGS